MKQLLLVALLLGLASEAKAQAALTVLKMFTAAQSMSANARAKQQDPQEYIRPVTYEGELFHCVLPVRLNSAKPGPKS
ncbi:MAG: hypothetical protein ACRYFV_14795 [Janthinobacterium lividum]